MTGANDSEREPVVAEMCIAVNEDGDWCVGQDEDEACERMDEEYGGGQRRIIKLNVDIAAVIPQVIEVSATLPQKEDGGYSLVIQES